MQPVYQETRRGREISALIFFGSSQVFAIIFAAVLSQTNGDLLKAVTNLSNSKKIFVTEGACSPFVRR